LSYLYFNTPPQVERLFYEPKPGLLCKQYFFFWKSTFKCAPG